MVTRQERRQQAREKILAILKTSCDADLLDEFVDNNTIAVEELCKITARLYRKVKNILEEI